MPGIKFYKIIILIATWAAVHFLLWHILGIRNLYDSARYIQSATYMAENGSFKDPNDVFYSVPIAMIAFFAAVFSGDLIPFLVLQSVLSCLAALTIGKVATSFFDDHRAGLAAGLIFLLWWDNIQWNTTVMTESLLCSSICFLMAWLSRFKNTVNDHVILLIIVILIFLVRPTGVVVIVGVIVFLIKYHWNYLSAERSRISILIFSLSLLALIGGGAMLNTWDFMEQNKVGNIVTYMDGLEGKPLYHSSLRSDISGLDFADGQRAPVFKIFYFIVSNPLYVLKTGSLKVLYLMTGLRPYYSTLHNAYLVLWMSAIYLLSYFGWKRIGRTPIGWFIMTVIIVNAAVIAISTVDWDNRFYIPMEPGIVVLAGIGTMQILDLANSRRMSILPKKR